MKPYYKYSKYLKDRFGERVSKVSVDAGFSCPNKDGKISKDGCIYCDSRTFNFYNRNDKIPTLEDQISLGIDAAKKSAAAAATTTKYPGCFIETNVIEEEESYSGCFVGFALIRRHQQRQHGISRLNQLHPQRK